MSNKNSESVKLLIEAEYLAEKEFKQAKDSVKELAQESEKTDKALEQLKIDKATIKSYGELDQEINDLNDSLKDAVATQKKVGQELGLSSKEYKKASRVVSTLKTDIKRNTATWNAQAKALKGYNITSKAVEQTVKDLNDKIEQSTIASKEQSKALKDASSELEQATAKQKALAEQKRKLAEAEKQLAEERKQLAKSMKAEFKAQDKLNKATIDAIKAREEELAQAKKSKEARDEEARQLLKTQQNIEKYKVELKKLNEQRREGYLTQGDWIRAEDKLRNSLELTTAQVNVHKRALEADEKQLRKNAEALESQNLEKYEKALHDLNEQRRSGLITSEQMEEKEKALRKQYKLTEPQVNKIRKALDKKNESLKKANKSTDLLTKATRRIAQAYVVALAIEKVASAVSATTQAYGELEGSMTAVTKTTGLAHDEIVQLKDSLNEMATEITPTATNELLKYAEVAGQLGISSRENLLDMAIASDALAISTNLAGEEASLLLTRMLLMTGEGVGHIHNISSAVTELGNNFAVAEDEIVHMGREVITATSAMGVGTASALAFGATLKESGQQAERSRTALQRMAQSITQASKNGGEDLIRLMKVTGLTADEIEKNLGDRPELIMLKFSEGLKQIKDSGGLVSETLEEMGIKSLESQAVLEVLADKSVRLADALYQSQKAYESHDKHLIEASKVYATQASAVGRLVNRFEELKAVIGESLTDEVSEGLGHVTEAMEETEDIIVQLMQLVGTLTTSLIEGMHDLLPIVKEVAGAFYHMGKGLQVSFNLAQVALDKMSISADKLKLAQLKAMGASKDNIEALEQTIVATQNRIDENWRDSVNASLIIQGKSSESYVQLQEAVRNNQEAVERLTDSEKEQLKVALETQGFINGNNRAYDLLTSAIESQVRAIGVEGKSLKLTNRLKAEETAVNERRVALSKKLVQSGVSLSEQRAKSQQQLESGIITKREFKVITEDLIALEEIEAKKSKEKREEQEKENKIERAQIQAKLELIEISSEASEQTIALTNSSNKYLEQINQLETEMVGLNVTSEKYLALQLRIDNINKDLAVSAENLHLQKELEAKTQDELIKLQQSHFLVLTDLAEQYNRNELSAKEYKDKVDALAFATAFYAENIQIETEVTNDLAIAKSGVTEKTKEEIVAEKELALAKKMAIADAQKSVEVKNLEKQSIDALLIAQELHQERLDNLKKRYQDGLITFIEYSRQLAESKEVTDFLNSALKEATDSTREFGDAGEKAGNQWINASASLEVANARLDSLSERAERAKNSGTGIAQGFTATSSAFDASTASASELSSEIDTLEGRIAQNSRVMRDSWWHSLASSQVELDKTSLATAKQAKKILELKERYEDLENPTVRTTDAISASIDAMGDLDDTSLRALRSEVADTQRAFDDLKDTINDSLDGVEDRLSALKGEEQAIQQRAHQRELDQAIELRDQAKENGDSEALKKANKLISKLKEAQRIERQNLSDEIKADSERAKKKAQDEKQKQSKKPEAPREKAGKKEDVVVINIGKKRTEIKGDKGDIMDLLEELGYTAS